MTKLFTSAELIDYGRKLLAKAGEQETGLSQSNFLDFAEQVRDAAQGLRHKPKDFADFSTQFCALRDDFAKEVELDPAILYRPKHEAALQFHQSPARFRYFYGGNRISKTVAGYMDDYWVVTGQHPWRPRPPIPSSVFIIGTNFSQYAPNVFEKKMLTGEPGNPLSPLFPMRGRWFSRYDERKHIIYLACRECALLGKARSCRHQKSSVVLFSDVEGPMVLAGGQYAQGHFDEQIREEFFSEATQRIKTVPNSGIIVTETPIYGRGWWTYKILYKTGILDTEQNMVPETGQKLVSLHTIDQFSAGLVPHESIKADMKMLSEQQIQARIFGKHVSDSQFAVFDLQTLFEMRKMAKAPHKIWLTPRGIGRKTFGDFVREKNPNPERRIEFRLQETPASNLAIWRKPTKLAQYIIGADVSQGLTNRDPSAAQVLKITSFGAELTFEQVASLHGWMSTHVYAEELYKLSHYYNDACLVVESNGPGDAVLQRLKEFGCWSLFRDIADPAQAAFTLDSRFGVDTNIRSKGLIISVLQGTIRRWREGRKSLVLYDEHTIEELESFIQEPTSTGISFRLKGAGSWHDDRVMALALAVYVASSYPVFDPYRERKRREVEAQQETDPLTRAAWDAFRKKEQRAFEEQEAVGVD